MYIWDMCTCVFVCALLATYCWYESCSGIIKMDIKSVKYVALMFSLLDAISCRHSWNVIFKSRPNFVHLVIHITFQCNLTSGANINDCWLYASNVVIASLSRSSVCIMIMDFRINWKINKWKLNSRFHYITCTNVSLQSYSRCMK